MNRGLLIINIVLLVLVGVLFYLHFSSKDKSPKLAGVQTPDQKEGAARIAYFEMDSINNHFNLVKQVETELSKREQEMTNDLARMEKQIMDKVREYQSQPMSQVQSEVATNDVRERQRQYELAKGKYDQEFQQLFMNKKVEVRTKIEEFLKDYNKDKRYTYIFSYEPGFIFYRDTMYNITGDLIKGLNEKYPKKENKK